MDRILAATGMRPGEVILAPPLGIDMASGRPLWTGQPPLVEPDLQFHMTLLDRGGSNRLPLLIGNGLGSTVCRLAMPATPEGAIAQERGGLCMPTSGASDPRWKRPLPWRTRLTGFFAPRAFLAAAGLALVNVVLPALLLRLIVGRRRAFRVWVLMVVPLVAAVPLTSYLMLTPWLQVGDGWFFASEKRVFLVGTLAGLPIVVCGLWILASLVRMRFRMVFGFVVLTVIASLVAAFVWIWLDRKSMAGIEYYGWEAWYLVLLPGAYAAAVLWVLGRGATRVYGLGRRVRVARTSAGATPPAPPS